MKLAGTDGLCRDPVERKKARPVVIAEPGSNLEDALDPPTRLGLLVDSTFCIDAGDAMGFDACLSGTFGSPA